MFFRSANCGVWVPTFSLQAGPVSSAFVYVLFVHASTTVRSAITPIAAATTALTFTSLSPERQAFSSMDVDSEISGAAAVGSNDKSG